MNTIYVTAFGAVPSSRELQTEKLQQAIDHCWANGGGEIRIPAGDFYTGGLRLRSGVCLHLEENAHLIGSRDPADYFAVRQDALEPLGEDDRTDARWLPMDVRENYDHMNKAGSAWNNAVIRAIDAENIAIIGEKGSYIDGQDCFDPQGEEYYRGPHAVCCFRCSNLTFRGYTIQNSANWAHALFDCVNVQMTDVTVIAGHDGVHLTSCKNIAIANCRFYTGDDCIAGIDNLNVAVDRCVLNTACSAFRFGGTNVRIDGCHIFGPAKYLFRGSLTEEEKRRGGPTDGGGAHRYNMLSAFTYYADFSREIQAPAGHILLQNCRITNADRFLHYNFSGNEPWQKNKPLTEIVFRSVTAEGIKNPVTAYGSPEAPVLLTMDSCALRFSDARGEAPFMHLCHFDRVTLKNTTVKNIKGDVLVKTWSDTGQIITENFDAPDFSGSFCVLTDEPFVCSPI